MEKYKKGKVFKWISIVLLLLLIFSGSWANKKIEMAEKYGVYADFILNEEYASDFDNGIEQVRYELMYLDDDEIPELLLCDGGYTRAPTWIYTMRDGSVKFLGKFSQYGNLKVLKGGSFSIICAEYGGHGFFIDVYTKMENGDLETIAVFASDGTGMYSDEILYYMGFPFSPNLHAETGQFDYSVLTEEYLVTEEEYEKAQAEITGYNSYITKEVEYDSMLEMP